MITNAANVMAAGLAEGSEKKSFSLNDGDMGLVIRKDGAVELFQQGVDTAALLQAHSSMTHEDRQALENGQLLMVLSTVASVPELQQSIAENLLGAGVVQIQAANAA